MLAHDLPGADAPSAALPHSQLDDAFDAATRPFDRYLEGRGGQREAEPSDRADGRPGVKEAGRDAPEPTPEVTKDRGPCFER